jgi:hypothetical protein
MEVDQFENARKTRKKTQQTFFSSTKQLVMTIIERNEKEKKKWKKLDQKLFKTKNDS